jgi:5-methyltetrahydropteroyltriglutamate--homocysteine methyltransferase
MNSTGPASYRSEVIGSLLRPDYLKQAIAQHQAGALSDDQLTAAQDRAVREAVALQESCGIDVITDGEMRRSFWFDPLVESLGGYTYEASAPVPFTGGTAQAAPAVPVRLPAVTAHLGPKANLPLREYQYLQDALRLVREMVTQLVQAGVRYIQLDAPRYTHLVSEVGIANFKRVGINPDTWLSEMIALDNALIEGFPGVTFGLHLCRGNARSMWSVEGGYDPIAEQLFNEIGVQRLLLEYDTPRAGSFAPLRFVPAEKSVVLGLITTKESEIESAELLKQRIEEASRYIPLERLALSPQCGFASVMEGNLITEEAQRVKLELLGRVARDVWG